MSSATPRNEPLPFEIRPYAGKDFARLCAIDHACFAAGIAYTPAEIALGLAQRGAFALVAEARGEVVAFVLAYQKKRAVGHIVTIDVLEAFRGRGIGQELMRLAEQRLRQQGAERIVLEVAAQNESAIRFYERLGYDIKRPLPRYYPDGSDAWLMEKTLPR